MKDQLEDFIRRNRAAFDDREPSPRLWSRIERSLGFQHQPWRNPLVLWRAAAIFFMAVSAFLLTIRFAPNESQPLAEQHVLREFIDIEAFYIQQISNKVEIIGQFKGSDGLNGFTHDFQQLEAMYQVLKEEMRARPSEKVKDALVLNLLVRIDLLNQQLHKLEEKEEEQAKPGPGEKSA